MGNFHLSKKRYALMFLQMNGISFVDKREKGGALWALCDESYKTVFAEAKKHGFYFHYSPNGSKSTSGKPGRWIK